MPDITFTLTDGFGSGTGQKRKISLQPATIRDDGGKLVLAGPPRDFYGARGVLQTVPGVAAGLWRVGDLDAANGYDSVLIEIPDSGSPVDIGPLILDEIAFPQNTTVQSLTQAVATYLDGQDLMTKEVADTAYAPLDASNSMVYGDPDNPDLPTSITVNGITTTLTYDADGNLSTKKVGTGPTRTASYDDDGRLTGIA